MRIIKTEIAWVTGEERRLLRIRQYFSGKIGRETVTNRSVHTVVEQDEAVNYTSEFLNSLWGMPPHALHLKLLWCPLLWYGKATSWRWIMGRARDEEANEQHYRGHNADGPTQRRRCGLLLRIYCCLLLVLLANKRIYMFAHTTWQLKNLSG